MFFDGIPVFDGRAIFLTGYVLIGGGMKSYCCMYRCRQCGTVFRGGTIDERYLGTFFATFRNEAATHNCKRGWTPVDTSGQAKFTIKHGGVGVGDLIGFWDAKKHLRQSEGD